MCWVLPLLTILSCKLIIEELFISNSGPKYAQKVFSDQLMVTYRSAQEVREYLTP
jgi:hypothetical protein